MKDQAIRIVEELGLVSHDLPLNIYPLKSTSASQETLVESVFEGLWNHRIVQIARYNLSKADQSNKFISKLSATIDRRMPGLRLALPYTRPYIRSILGTHLLMFIKGSALSTIYPTGMVRDQADVDVYIPDFNTLSDVLAKVSQPYSYGRLKMYLCQRMEVAGSIDLRHELGSKGGVGIDVHVGAFPIWGGTKYDADLWERRVQMEDGFIPSWEDSLLIVAAHIGTQWFYRMRDVNDAFLIIDRFRCNLDWDYIVKSARENSIEGILLVLFDKAREIYGDSVMDNASFREGYNITWRYFRRKNWGSINRISAILSQTDFTINRYARDYRNRVAIVESIRNAINMVLYDNRAFAAHERKVIRRLKPNEVLVLVPLNKQVDHQRFPVNGERIGSTPIKVFHKGSRYEYIFVSQFAWAQANYQGVLDESTKRRLRSVIAHDLSRGQNQGPRQG